MALLAQQGTSLAGLNPVYSPAAAGGDTFVNPQGTLGPFAHVKNGGGAAITLTIPRVTNIVQVQGEGPVALAGLSISIPAGQERMIGPFPQSFNNASGQVQLQYSAVTSVTVAIINEPAI